MNHGRGGSSSGGGIARMSRQSSSVASYGIGVRSSSGTTELGSDPSATLDDDDNAAPDLEVDSDEEQERAAEAAADPLLVAIDDLEGRVVTALDEFKSHPGVRRSASKTKIHDELSDALRPVLEIAAHVGPATARSHAAYRVNGVEGTVEEVYQRLNSDLILPVILETAQSDPSPAKRVASLRFFHSLHRECQLAGSYLDETITGPLAGPYGPGRGAAHAPTSFHGQSASSFMHRRALRKSARAGELLRYWVEASASCCAPGAFTDSRSDGVIAGRAVISAGAAVRPALRRVSERISAADDAGALKLYGPLVRMITGVFNRLFRTHQYDNVDQRYAPVSPKDDAADALRSACIKFLEIVVMCFSTKAQPGAPPTTARRKNQNTDDFSLEDLPTGHPIITREALEEIGDFAFTTLCGLTIVGGQVKIDPGMLREFLTTQGMDASGYRYSPSAQIVEILKPAALAYLEVESSVQQGPDGQWNLDRRNLELDFFLSHKSYTLTINAVSMLATNRPIFYCKSTSCLARRTMDPPKSMDEHDTSSTREPLSKAAAKGIQSALRASCLTLLRNSLSVTAGGWELLHRALTLSSMGLQADKALAAAKHQADLRKATRKDRTRAAIFYQWDQSEVDRRSVKRQRDTDDALAKMRAAKAARGLGQGIQLPTSMVDAAELVLVNLRHLPNQRPSQPPPTSTIGGSAVARKRPITLDFVLDAIMTNGASLSSDESRWYVRDGGAAWTMTLSDSDRAGRVEFALDPKTLQAARRESPTKTATGDVGNTTKTNDKGVDNNMRKVFDEQCKTAASDAFSRIVMKSASIRSRALSDFGHKIAARLAWTLKGVQPSSDLTNARDIALESIDSAKNMGSSGATVNDEGETEKRRKSDLRNFATDFPLVASCLALNVVSNERAGNSNIMSGVSAGTASSRRSDHGGISSSVLQSSATSSPFSLAPRVLYEAYMESHEGTDDNDQTAGAKSKLDKYERSLDVFVSSAVRASERANEKPNDNTRKRVATVAASSLQKELNVVPLLTPSALAIASSMCDIDEITKKAVETARKTSQHTLASSAAVHAAKAAAEKRATAALVALRDSAFQRSRASVRRAAVDCAVGIAAGRLPGSASVEGNALKLVMNVIYPKSNNLADTVVASATEELERAAAYAISVHEQFRDANVKKIKESEVKLSPTDAPLSDEEKGALEKVRKPVVLFMALCVRQADIIKTLLSVSSRKGADILAKAVKNNMQKLARSASIKYGAATIALRVAEMADDESETPLLLAFLNNLPDSKTPPSQELIDACHSIQKERVDAEGKADARYILPILSGVKRAELVGKLPEFASAADDVFKAALKRMSERTGRHLLAFRDEPDEENPNLHGMTLCEQMVFLHRLDFSAVGLPQKRYLHIIRLCLDDDAIFTDRVVMAALDYISNTFLGGDEGLPLAYMRTIILTCSKHESLHAWICHVLLPRLIEGKVYGDRRQWEGWMRCARMLENSGGGISSVEAIKKLPEEQLRIYRAKYPERS